MLKETTDDQWRDSILSLASVYLLTIPTYLPFGMAAPFNECKTKAPHPPGQSLPIKKTKWTKALSLNLNVGQKLFHQNNKEDKGITQETLHNNYKSFSNSYKILFLYFFFLCRNLKESIFECV